MNLSLSQLITPTRSLVLGAETRKEMEDWCQAMKAAAAREFFDPTPPDQHDFLSGHHHWYATSHARPTYCNVSCAISPRMTMINNSTLTSIRCAAKHCRASRRTDCRVKCANSKCTSDAQPKQYRTVSGPHWLASARKSSRSSTAIWSCRTSGWRATCRCRPSVCIVIKRAARCCDCRTGGVSGVGRQSTRSVGPASRWGVRSARARFRSCRRRRYTRSASMRPGTWWSRRARSRRFSFSVSLNMNFSNQWLDALSHQSPHSSTLKGTINSISLSVSSIHS